MRYRCHVPREIYRSCSNVRSPNGRNSTRNVCKKYSFTNTVTNETKTVHGSLPEYFQRRGKRRDYFSGDDFVFRQQKCNYPNKSQNEIFDYCEVVERLQIFPSYSAARLHICANCIVYVPSKSTRFLLLRICNPNPFDRIIPNPFSRPTYTYMLN